MFDLTVVFLPFSSGLNALDFFEKTVLFKIDVLFPADLILSMRCFTDFDVLDKTGENVLYFEFDLLFT